MTYVPTKDIKIKERQDKFLKAQLEKEREQALLEEIEKTEKERVKKKGLKTLKQSGILDAYQGLLVSLCKYGLPTQDLYEFSALTILKHEKKLKAQKKKDLQERLKQRDASKQLNPLRARAVSTNPLGVEERQQIHQVAQGLSPSGKARGNSKRKIIGGASVEKPDMSQNGAATSVTDSQKQSKSSKAPATVAGEGEEANVAVMEEGANDDNKPKKRTKKKRSEAVEETKGAAPAEEENAAPADEEAPKKKKKKRANAQPEEGQDEQVEAVVTLEEAEPPRKKKKKRATAEGEEGQDAGQRDSAEMLDVAPVEEAPKKKKKKKTTIEPAAEEAEPAAAAEDGAAEAEAPKKKRKKKKDAEGEDA